MEYTGETKICTRDQCTRAGQHLSLREFSYNKNTGKYAGYCKACRAELARERYTLTEKHRRDVREAYHEKQGTRIHVLQTLLKKAEELLREAENPVHAEDTSKRHQWSERRRLLLLEMQKVKIG